MGVKVAIKHKFTRLDEKRVTKRLHTSLVRLWKEAVREYLRAKVLTGAIHVDTGMSAASVLPLARAVRIFTEINASIIPVRERQGVTDMSGIWHPHRMKNKAAGEAAGRKAYKMLFGSNTRPVFVFEFNINVYQYMLHENGFAQPYIPWESLDQGMEAFLARIRDGHLDLPNLIGDIPGGSGSDYVR